MSLWLGHGLRCLRIPHCLITSSCGQAWGGVWWSLPLGKPLQCFPCVLPPRLHCGEVGSATTASLGVHPREAGSATRQGWVCWPSPRAGLRGYVFFPQKAAPVDGKWWMSVGRTFGEPPSKDGRAGPDGSWGPVPLLLASPGQCGHWCACTHPGPYLCGWDSAEVHFRRFPWKPGSQREEGVFPRQLRPRREVARARLGEMAFPGDELLQLGTGKRDVSASSPLRFPESLCPWAVLYLQTLTQGFVFAGAGRSRSETFPPTCSGR